MLKGHPNKMIDTEDENTKGSENEGVLQGKKKWFFPSIGKEVEAETYEEALEVIKNQQ